MDAQRKKLLLFIVEKEISDKRKRLDQAGSVSRDYAEITMGSWSANGDRANAENITHLLKEGLTKLEQLRQEIINASDSPAETVTPPCFAILRDEKRQATEEIYLVNTSASLVGAKLVTSQSPLGQVLLNRRLGEIISYQLGPTTFSKTIEKLE